MGFGICTLGYLMTVFDSLGGGIIGWPLLAFGFWKLSKVNRLFRVSSAMSVLCIAFSLIDLGEMLNYVDQNGQMYKWAYIGYILLKAFIHLTYLLGIRQLTKEGAPQIALSSFIWMLFIEAYFILSLLSAFLPQTVGAALGGALVISKYFVGAAGLWIIFTCYAKITTADRIEKDREAHRRITEKDEERKRRRQEKDKEDEK